MKPVDDKQLQLAPEEVQLLAWAIANEVLNGFEVSDFFQRIGTSRLHMTSVAKRMRSSSRSGEVVILDLREAKIFRNALALTLRELGIEEFSTRTGFTIEEGQTALCGLHDFVEGGGQSC